MRVALTVWEGRISPVLDTARSVAIADIAEGTPGTRRDEILPEDSPHGKVAQLRALDVEVLVCGAVSRPLASLVSSSGIRLIPFVAGELDEVLEAVITGRIPDSAFSMPGCGCQRRRRFRGWRKGGGGTPQRASHDIAGIQSDRERE